MKTPKSRRKSSSKKNAPSPKNNYEIIITLLLFFAFIIYGAGQCNRAKISTDFQEDPIAQELKLETKNSEASQLSDNPEEKINLPQLVQKQASTEESPATKNSMREQNSKQNNNIGAQVDSLQKFNRLWVTIDQLKLRSEPNLKSELLIKLNLFDRVYYLNQKTPFLQKINLGYEVANEPWLYVQHENGTKGWAYGAGLNFHKQKRSGILE